MRALIICCLLLTALPVGAREIEGVNVPERTCRGTGGQPSTSTARECARSSFLISILRSSIWSIRRPRRKK